MAEVAGEATHVWSTKAGIAIFHSAMRQFLERLLRRGWEVHYRQLSLRPRRQAGR